MHGVNGVIPHLAATKMEFLPNLEPAGGYSYLKARCNNGKSLTEE